MAGLPEEMWKSENSLTNSGLDELLKASFPANAFHCAKVIAVEFALTTLADGPLRMLLLDEIWFRGCPLSTLSEAPDRRSFTILFFMVIFSWLSEDGNSDEPGKSLTIMPRSLAESIELPAMVMFFDGLQSQPL